jgi:glucose/arabinose dehydrogenase
MKKHIKIIVLFLLALCVGWYIFIADSSEEISFTTQPPEEASDHSSEATETAPTPTRQETFVLATTTVTTADGTEQSFLLPEGAKLAIAAEGLGKARFMSWAPDGRLFVPDMVDYVLSPDASLWVLGDFDSETGSFGSKDVFLSNLRGVNDVDFYRDADGKDWIYVAETAYLKRYPYTAGDMSPSGPAEIVTYFPAQQSPGEVSVVWHITRTVEFVNDRMYISIGSGCNSCEDLAGERAMITVMNPDGTDVRTYATGLRNVVGMEWANGQLYATANGVDHLGGAPNEALFAINDGVQYAWPYCYLEDGIWKDDTSQVWRTDFSCADAPAPLAVFPSRSAALGVTYFDHSAHPMLLDSFLVSLHGSFEASRMSGYKIMRVTPSGEQAVFMDGFQLPDATRVARPVDILAVDAQSFLFTDDFGGRIYHVRLP